MAGARGALGFPETDRLLDGVVVHRGDSLWDIARRHLGPDAGDAEVAEAWPAWYDRNRAVIGDDPDAILPGQILHPPTQNTRTTQATRPAEPAEPAEPALTGPTGSTGSTGPTTGGQR